MTLFSALFFPTTSEISQHSASYLSNLTPSLKNGANCTEAAHTQAAKGETHMKTFFPLILLLAGLSITSQAQTGLFIDYTQSGWYLQLNGAVPNQTFNYTMIQSAGSGTIMFALTLDGTYSHPLPISITTDGSGKWTDTFLR